MAFALASAASASALKKGFSGEGTIIAISFFCCATAGIAPTVSRSVGIASNLTMDFQFRGLFVGIMGLVLGWGLGKFSPLQGRNQVTSSSCVRVNVLCA